METTTETVAPLTAITAQQRKAYPLRLTQHDTGKVDIFADALLTDDASHILFLSLWGHDTAVKALMAQLTLPTDQGGIDHFYIGDAPQQQRVWVPNTDRLEKLSGRTPDTTVFGGLSHLWLFDRLCQRPDSANRCAWLLTSTQEDKSAMEDRLWVLIQSVCHMPLLRHWKVPVMAFLRSENLLQERTGLGINGISVDLDQAIIEQGIAERVQSGLLTLDNADNPI